jgi:hypothetical protein
VPLTCEAVFAELDGLPDAAIQANLDSGTYRAEGKFAKDLPEHWVGKMPTWCNGRRPKALGS